MREDWIYSAPFMRQPSNPSNLIRLDTMPRFVKRPSALDQGRYERFAAFLIELELIAEIGPVEDYTAVIR